MEIEAVLPVFRVVHVLSHPNADCPGYRGQIDESVLTQESPEPHLWSYYLSGPPSLGRSMRELLLEWGIRPDAIKVERFDGYE
jgi:ferredoxin-NADP reductase